VVERTGGDLASDVGLVAGTAAGGLAGSGAGGRVIRRMGVGRVSTFLDAGQKQNATNATTATAKSQPAILKIVCRGDSQD
jgi:hypothetical protein